MEGGHVEAISYDWLFEKNIKFTLNRSCHRQIPLLPGLLLDNKRNIYNFEYETNLKTKKSVKTLKIR